MKRRTPVYAAARSAFGASVGAPTMSAAGIQHLQPAAVAFVVGFPGGIGAIALAAALSRSGMSDGAFPLAIGLLTLAGLLLVLGIRSAVSVSNDEVTVRFFGLRTTTVRFRDLRSATFGMAFPSISYAITLAEQGGCKALVHANWWRDEPVVVQAVCRALVRYDVPLDRSTARVVSKVLRVKRPEARIRQRWDPK